MLRSKPQHLHSQIKCKLQVTDSTTMYSIDCDEVIWVCLMAQELLVGRKKRGLSSSGHRSRGLGWGGGGLGLQEGAMALC